MILFRAPYTLTLCIVTPHTVFAHVHDKGGSVLKAGVDLLPFLVFFPSLLYWGATSDIALKRVPVLMVSVALLNF